MIKYQVQYAQIHKQALIISTTHIDSTCYSGLSYSKNVRQTFKRLKNLFSSRENGWNAKGEEMWITFEISKSF